MTLSRTFVEKRRERSTRSLRVRALEKIEDLNHASHAGTSTVTSLSSISTSSLAKGAVEVARTLTGAEQLARILRPCLTECLVNDLAQGARMEDGVMARATFEDRVMHQREKPALPLCCLRGDWLMPLPSRSYRPSFFLMSPPTRTAMLARSSSTGVKYHVTEIKPCAQRRSLKSVIPASSVDRPPTPM